MQWVAEVVMKMVSYEDTSLLYKAGNNDFKPCCFGAIGIVEWGRRYLGKIPPVTYHT